MDIEHALCDGLGLGGANARAEPGFAWSTGTTDSGLSRTFWTALSATIPGNRTNKKHRLSDATPLMNWTAIGAIGEIVGALAVVFTLVVLIIQVRHSTQATQETNRLERAAAIDRHAETIARWRARLIENRELTEVWLKAYRDEVMDDVDLVRITYVFIEFVNTQRSNYVRAMSVGEQGLAQQAVRAIAGHAADSKTYRLLWTDLSEWTKLASPAFTSAVDAEVDRMEQEGVGDFHPMPTLNRIQPDGTLA